MRFKWEVEDMDIEEASEETKDAFEIVDDKTADWAVGKINEHRDERDRLNSLIALQLDELAQRITELHEMERKNIDDCSRKCSYLMAKLYEYFGTVKPKESKTQGSYKLLNGTLIRKNSHFDMDKDETALKAWVEANRPDMIKTTTAVRWADLKKELQIVDGMVVTADGELVEGVQAVLVPESFDVK